MAVRGVAGAGAEGMARRAAEREAELEAQLAQARRSRAAWEAGAAGERAVAVALDALVPAGWLVLHDVHWPGRPLANLDHIAVGPGGVVLVDAKNWSGDVAVKDGVLRQNGYRRDRVADSACAAAAAVTAMLAPQHRGAVRTAVCFVQQDLDPQVLGPGAVHLGIQHLAGWLRSLPPVLRPDDVTAIHGYLSRELTGPRSPQQVTTADLERPAARVVEPSARARQIAGRTARPAPPPRRPATSRPRTAPTRRSGTAPFKFAVAVIVMISAYIWVQNAGERLAEAPPATTPVVTTPSQPPLTP